MKSLRLAHIVDCNLMSQERAENTYLVCWPWVEQTINIPLVTIDACQESNCIKINETRQDITLEGLTCHTAVGHETSTQVV